ncbi:OmpA family protein [Promicromonospora iranensis]|uniref:Outer membrane protein OmpA-like peptidoglycan-associated protein n=1 Tax=Promicromonospora iranensis TaxID=1105144 RepID=A0ABU2CMH9_9MICO|nr:OmpA family protein [Promicromonospora iranensis]MDR7382486.1 outer membrane protein OmpA-like peptidoglycan-associated protein [Promicromonospora iranensis]
MTLVAGALAAALALGAAGTDGTAAPTPSADPALMAEITERQQADLEELSAVTVTDAMRAAATLDLAAEDARWDLSAEDATWDLHPDDSTTPLETVVEEDETTTVRLTSDLLFQFGKHQITRTAGAAVADLLDEVPQGAKVAVDGHTDSIGDDGFNRGLSERRADAVADVLRSARPDLRLTVKGHGETQPIAENMVDGKDNPVGRAKNRRVEISYDAPAD